MKTLRQVLPCSDDSMNSLSAWQQFVNREIKHLVWMLSGIVTGSLVAFWPKYGVARIGWSRSRER
jgi:hypothetical protein